MKRLTADCETNGLMPEVNKLHSLVLKNRDTGQYISGASQPHTVDHLRAKGLDIIQMPMEDVLGTLAEADEVWGHNFLGYDIPVIEHLVPGWKLKASCRVRDSLVMAKMIWPAQRQSR